jgi:hypothetical protein
MLALAFWCLKVLGGAKPASSAAWTGRPCVLGYCVTTPRASLDFVIAGQPGRNHAYPWSRRRQSWNLGAALCHAQALKPHLEETRRQQTQAAPSTGYGHCAIPAPDIWRFPRQNHLSNRIFKNDDDTHEACQNQGVSTQLQNETGRRSFPNTASIILAAHISSPRSIMVGPRPGAPADKQAWPLWTRPTSPTILISRIASNSCRTFHAGSERLYPSRPERPF